MKRTLRTALVLCLGAEAVAACGRKAANGDTGTPPPSATTTADSSASATAPAETTQTPPTITRFGHGEASLTYGTPLKWRLVQGTFDASTVDLEYSPTGQARGTDDLRLIAGRRTTGDYNVMDIMMSSAHRGWQLGSAEHYRQKNATHCTIAVSEAGASGVRGTITCSGDPQGPTGPITFSATP